MSFEMVRRSLNCCEGMLVIEKALCESLLNLKLNDQIAFVYNPLDYASETHEDYVRKYCRSTKDILFLGMNPGPFGMAQNGVPFGDTHYVKNWLNIKGSVQKPDREHPRRLIHGLHCVRSEVSGQRFWSFLEDISKTPDVFFSHCYVHNYCPLSFMTSSGKNVTPPEIQSSQKKVLLDICDKSILEVIKLLHVKFIIGIGKFAEGRARKVIKEYQITNVKVFGIMHPSPINPFANKGWKDIIYRQLSECGILQYFQPL